MPIFDYARFPACLEKFVGSALSTRQGIFHNYILASHVLAQEIPGCFVECGVASGGAAGPLLQAMVDLGEPRQLHLLDSFCGIPLAGPMDDDQPGLRTAANGVYFIKPREAPLAERLVTSGVSAASVELVRSNLARWSLPSGPPQVQYHQGWFQDTLPTVAASFGPIAFLRLDGDLYESTLVCLEHLYGQVVPGGLVLIDDWARHDEVTLGLQVPLTDKCRGPQRAVYDYLQAAHLAQPAVHVAVDYGAAYWFK